MLIHMPLSQPETQIRSRRLEVEPLFQTADSGTMENMPIEETIAQLFYSE